MIHIHRSKGHSFPTNVMFLLLPLCIQDDGYIQMLELSLVSKSQSNR